MMNEHRTHRAISHDGTDIAGRVYGHGPSLVLVHGSLEDGDLDWEAMLPFLTERFTCYLMSTRCRGLSGNAADLSPERRTADVTAFVDSIGGPVNLLGESDGATLALGAAARSPAVAAVAVHEPPVFEVLDERTAARFEDTVRRTGEAADAGRPAEAARVFAEFVANEDELAALSTSGYFEECARYIPTFLRELQQQETGTAPSPTDPAVLAKIAAPVLVLHGSRSAQREFFGNSVRHVVEYVPDVRVHEVAGSGHWGVMFAAERIADEIGKFLIEQGRLGQASHLSTCGERQP